MPNKSTLLSNAKSLRKNLTKIDFYCDSCRLAVELDGSQHYEEEAFKYDENRTKFLNEQGIRVIRILNKDIDDNFKAVCRLIDSATSQSANADSSSNRGANNRIF